jgi:hypothetical protein
MGDEERAADMWENDGGRAFGEVSGESLGSKPVRRVRPSFY